MRNLLETKSSRLPSVSTEYPEPPLSAVTWDSECDGFICAFGPTQEHSIIEVARIKNGSTETIATWNHDDQTESHSEPEKILSILHFSDSKTICLAFSHGDLVLVREDPSPEQGKVEIVGTVDGGIESALWSPDEEIIAILSAKRHFMLMSRYFEELSDISITSEDLRMSKHVNVGWGNSATQFKGKRAAAMRDPTVPERIDEGLLSAQDTGKSKLSWRGDGAFIALSTVDEGSRRVIRVFGRLGELESVSEPVDFLTGHLTWKPSGSFIASVQYPKNDNAQVVFFEKNGLRHGGFSLREPLNELNKCIISDIAWNSDSSVLAVCTTNNIQLWTMGNYHWYLKKEIKLQFPIESMLWHPNDHLTIGYCGNGTIFSHSFVWSTSIGAVNPPNDYGQIAVVDGKSLKLSPLRLANIPPPFALHEITLCSTPSDVVFSKDGSLIAVLHDSFIEMISWNLSMNLNDIKPQLQTDDGNFIKCEKARQICFRSNDELHILHNDGKKGSIITKFELNRETGSWCSTSEHRTSKLILRLLSCMDNKCIFYEDIDGLITDFDGTDHSIKLPEPCPWVQVSGMDNMTTVFGLSESGKLYANSRLLSSGCTSFLATSDHLAFTVSSHTLKFVHLVGDVEDLEVPTNNPSTDERCRSIERGARIVHICPSTFSVILQMPRGNLETIFPRILVLAGIRRCIDGLDYASAFRICRTHRVDLNILFDYKPDQFMGNIDRFIAELDNASYLDLFLSQIRNEDTSNKSYRQTAPSAHGGGSDRPQTELLFYKSNASKVNSICNAFLETLQGRPTEHSQTIITAHVCKEPPDFDSALKLISEIHDVDGTTKRSESAIEHIIFLSDASKLYDHALGIYNIDLALMIAEKSQKDPREYLPFLQSLQEMPTQRRKYTIDDLLGRLPKALEHLSLCEGGTSDEFKNYMTKHRLYQTALDICRSDIQKRNEIMLMYATYLNENSKFKDAAIAFEFLDQYQMATEAYRKAGLWQQAIYCATRAGQGYKSIQSIAESFAESLYETKEYQSAAKLYLEYLDNIELALKALCKGYFFEEAMRIAASKQQLGCIEKIIDTELVEAFNATTEFIVDCRDQIKAQLLRLQELRQRRIDEPLSYFDGQVEEDAPDNVSLAITNTSTIRGSIYTRYTGKTRASGETTATRRTEKNRRRQDRKKAKGKKGTIYEAEYLFASIKRLIERVERAQGDFTRLVEALVRRGMKERAESIQHGIEDILSILRTSRPEVLEQMRESFIPSEDGIQSQGSVESLANLPLVSQFESLSILCPFTPQTA